MKLFAQQFKYVQVTQQLQTKRLSQSPTSYAPTLEQTNHIKLGSNASKSSWQNSSQGACCVRARLVYGVLHSFNLRFMIYNLWTPASRIEVLFAEARTIKFIKFHSFLEYVPRTCDEAAAKGAAKAAAPAGKAAAKATADFRFLDLLGNLKDLSFWDCWSVVSLCLWWSIEFFFWVDETSGHSCSLCRWGSSETNPTS